MKSENIKSLEEVLEMKEAVWKDFLKSGYDSYAKFIENDVFELKQNLQKRSERKQKQILAA
jgi:hypothetical protein